MDNLESEPSARVLPPPPVPEENVRWKPPWEEYGITSEEYFMFNEQYLKRSDEEEFRREHGLSPLPAPRRISGQAPPPWSEAHEYDATLGIGLDDDVEEAWNAIAMAAEEKLSAEAFSADGMHWQARADPDW